MKEKLGKQIFKETSLFFVFIYVIELLVMLNAGNTFLTWASLRVAISTLGLSVIFGTISALLNPLWKNIITTIICTFISVYSWIEINLYTYMGFFMGVGNAEQGTKIIDYIKDFIGASKLLSYLVIVPLIIILVYIWYIRKKIKTYKLNKTVYFVFKKETSLSKTITICISLILFVLLGGLYYASLKVSFMQNKLQTIKNTDLIISSDNSNLSVSQFGLLMYGASDIFTNIFDIEPKDLTYINEGTKEKEITDLSRKIDDTAWQYVIDKETSETYNQLNNYFINREITDKNDYTGIYEGKNLIVVLMESVNMIAINEKEFPNLYKIYSGGTSFVNNYTPRNNCSTGNNEMTVMTSLFTINNTCTANTYKNNKYFEAIFNMFNNSGYQTSSYHDYAEYYYARKTIHPNMGSMKYYNVNDLDIAWSSVYEEWPSDVDLIEKATPNFINQEHFMAFITSVTTHQPYSVSSENGNKHLTEFADYDYSTAVKRYMSKMKELDAAMGLLLQKLEESGKLENTVIALFADHYPYGLTTSQINEVLDYDVTVNQEVDRTPMVIYNPGQEPEVVTKYTSIIDLLPTLLNMFNLNYDPRLYLGHDIMSDYDARTVFADGSWQDELGFYSATSGKFKPIDPTNTYLDEVLININNEIHTRQKMSALAIKKDYFYYLNNRINKYNEMISEQQTTTAIKESEENND